jgi:hypothetical protein
MDQLGYSPGIWLEGLKKANRTVFQQFVLYEDHPLICCLLPSVYLSGWPGASCVVMPLVLM